MSHLLIKAKTIVTMDRDRRVIQHGGLVIRDNLIERVLTSSELEQVSVFEGSVVNASGLVMIPGFVQTHIHLCQTLFRGLADDLDLLDWLRLKIFPFEAAHSSSSAYASAMAGIADLVRSGTTTIMDMGTVHHEEDIIRAVKETGIRAFVGKAMMDINTIYTPLKETTSEALSTTRALAEKWHRAERGRIRYAVAPRFVLSCTDSLLQEAFEMTRSFPGMLFHTHAAENRREMEKVRKRCRMGNIEHFDTLHILDSNTCLAHCIWVDDREMSLMEERAVKVAHCPSANLKLGSGIAPVPRMRNHRITVSLGADGAPCNNALDMFHEMRLAALIQKPEHGPSVMDAFTVFEMATLGGAAALSLSDEVGSIEAGKKADIALLDLTGVWNPYTEQNADTVYSTIVYSGSAENVRSVMIDGIWVYSSGMHETLDEEAVKKSARHELQQLLGRMQ
ncbi:MAG: 5'-deoxyadenosine deaminase [Ignavibacteria bacterium]|nr:5'-deoxyadenosine deaminase [Ignavibacteria bacterium]